MLTSNVSWAVCLALLGFAQFGTCQTQTIAQIASDTPELSTLVAALEAASLVDTLSADGTYTVFAPTNAAFAAFLQANSLTEDNLLNSAELGTYLTYHVLDTKVESGDIGNGDVVTTLASGLSVGFDTTDGVKIVHGATPKATVTTADIQASNGVIHIIDTVLQFPTQNLAELATGAGLSQLVGAVGTAGLSSTLSGDGPFTVFAPSNEAFEAIPEELPASLADIILYHVVDGIVLSNALENGMMVTTKANDTKIGIAITPTGVMIAHAASPKATVTDTDVMATNGIVHLIDRVLIPPTMTITEMVVGTDDLSTLLAAVQAAGLAEALADTGPLTVFAPNNEGAESTLNATGLTAAELLASDNLTKFLQYHVTNGNVLSSTLTVDTEIATLGDMTLPFVADGDSDNVSILTPGNIVTADLIATNGVVHIVNKMMIPADPPADNSSAATAGMITWVVMSMLLLAVGPLGF